MFEGRLGHRARASFFVIGSIGIWLIWCLGPLVNNQPEKFQAAGSIIVAWGIYSYGRERVTREKSISISENNAIISAIEDLRASLAFHGSLAENTANVQTLNYLKLLRTLGLSDQGVDDIDSTIKKLEKLTLDHSGHEALFLASSTARKTVSRSTERMTEVRTNQAPLAVLLTKLELYFVLFGTLQWGYGNKWVEDLHNFVIPTISGW